MTRVSLERRSGRTRILMICPLKDMHIPRWCAGDIGVGEPVWRAHRDRRSGPHGERRERFESSVTSAF
jgi:hypothetical protein